MKNIDIQEFFLSWGLDAEDDTSEIPEAVYDRMWADAAKVGGERLQKACNRFVNAVDGGFYLKCNTWDEMRRVYDTM